MDAQKMQEKLDTFMQNSHRFRSASEGLSHFMHQQWLNQGESMRDIEDILHGKQIGHPLHPILTHLTVGSWSLAFMFDVVGFLTGSKGVRWTANTLTYLGTFFAVPTAITGMTDYSTVKQEAVGQAGLHGLVNSLAFLCYVRSSAARLMGSRDGAFFYSLLGMGFVTVGAWLGGDMVYRHRVGVNNSVDKGVEDWTPVIHTEDLEEGKPALVQANGNPILMFRYGEKISAISAVCSHAGGPLDEGRVVNETCIECPWHQSVYDMRDGDVVHGPSTFNQRRYSTRVRNGQIEVRDWEVGFSPADFTAFDTPASEPELLFDENNRKEDKITSTRRDS